MMNEEQIDEGVISSEEINRIAILSQLNTDTDQIFDIPKNKEQP
jgi:hypothetical protein